MEKKRQYLIYHQFDRHQSPKSRLESHHLVVTWIEDGDGHGFSGSCKIYNGDRPCKGHSIQLRLTRPLGKIVAMLDGESYGCFRSVEFEGVDLSLRDLQWATKWAALAIELKHQDDRWASACEE